MYVIGRIEVLFLLDMQNIAHGGNPFIPEHQTGQSESLREGRQDHGRRYPQKKLLQFELSPEIRLAGFAAMRLS